MTETVDPNLQVTEALNSYLNLSASPLYALMLDGPWGSGKTHYVQEIISLIKSESRKVIHVSLYGLTTTVQIDEKIFQNLHPFFSSGKVKTARKLLASVASIALRYDISAGDVKGDVDFGIPAIDAEDFLSKEVDHIMFFDDFERCLLDPKVLLGYINYFVEHLGLKVIIATNEAEIVESSENEYFKAKEKVIGVTYKILPNIDSALKKFINDLSPKDYVNKIELSFNLIKNTFDDVNIKNLRNLRQILLQFESIYKILPQKAIANQEFFSEFIRLYIVIALENLCVELKTTELVSIMEGESFANYVSRVSSKNDIAKNDTREKILIEKYKSLRNLNISNQSPDFWIALFIDKNIDVILLENLINSHPQFIDDISTQNWKKLWWWYKLKQDEFEEILDQTLVDLNKNSLKNVFEVMHACCTIYELIELGLCKNLHTVEKWKVEAEKYFQQLSGRTQVPIASNHRLPTFDFDMGYEGLGYSKSKIHFLSYANNAKERELKRAALKKSNDLLNALATSIEKFEEFIDDVASSYPRLSIFDNIDILQLIPLIDKFETTEEWRLFTNSIDAWFKNNRDFSKENLVEKLKPFIDKKLKETKGKIIHQGVNIFFKRVIEESSAHT